MGSGQEAELQPGSKVRVHGLRVAVELNNVRGEIERWDDAKGRWRVRLFSGDTKAFLPENLHEEVPLLPSARRMPKQQVLECPFKFSSFCCPSGRTVGKTQYT